MAKYKYTAKNADGTVINGFSEAENESRVASQLKRQQYYIINIEHVPDDKKLLDSLFKNKIKLNDLAIFCRQLASLLEAGVTVVRALDILYQQSTKKNVKEVVRKLYENVQRGGLLSEAFEKSGDEFPEIILNMVSIGEASGNLDVTMNKVAEQLEKDVKVKNKIITAMIYPVILAVVALAVVLLLVTFVLPTFTGIFESMGTDLPATTKLLIAFADAVRNYWYLIIAFIIAIIAVFKTYTKTDKGRLAWDQFKLKLPVLGNVLMKITTSRFCHTMYTMLSSGVPIVTSIDTIARALGNKVYSDGLMAIKEDLRKGMTLAQAIRKFGKFPPAVASMVNIGEESGTLDKLIEKLADYYDNETDTAIQSMLSTFEPAVIIIMAVVVGFIVLSIITPIFSIYNSIS